ncbi:hypothetical protein [Halobaculum litoreum]|uniref:hypothetical protein n=1 Tax=Halobaculum litoreum TaxID=3031998 RepID=UPI0024C37BF4|nr:hypothetical protein [Halobaculum sp. DT92]
MSQSRDAVDVLRYPDGRVVVVPAGDGRIVVDAESGAGRSGGARRLAVWLAVGGVLAYAVAVAGNLLLGVAAASLLYVAFRWAGHGRAAAAPTVLAEDAPAGAVDEVFDVDDRRGPAFAEERHRGVERAGN